MSTSARRAARSAALVALLSGAAAAQSLYQLDANPARIIEHNAGPGGPCAYPAGPVLDGFGVVGASGCGVILPFLGGSTGLGGLSMDRYNDRLWVASDDTIVQMEIGGVGVTAFPNPLADSITGIAYEATSGRLWISSRSEYARVIVGCGGSTIDRGPYPSPSSAGIQALTWDDMGLRLWAAFDDGIVGAFGPGAAGLSCAVDVTSLGLTSNLLGLDLDTRTPGVGTPAQAAFVLDADQVIARVDLTASCSSGVATLMPPDFAFPASLFPASVTMLPSGLAFASRGVVYGGGSGPEIDLLGSAVPGNTVSVTLDGAAAGVAALFVDQSALCPVALFKGLSLHVAPLLVLGPVAHGGSLSVPAPLPAALPPGVEVHMQWFNKDAATGAFESTPALMFETSRP